VGLAGVQDIGVFCQHHSLTITSYCGAWVLDGDFSSFARWLYFIRAVAFAIAADVRYSIPSIVGLQ
jgi:hypothetical protein